MNSAAPEAPATPTSGHMALAWAAHRAQSARMDASRQWPVTACMPAVLLVVVLLASCGVAPSTPPPRLEAFRGLWKVAGVEMELLDPARLDGSPVGRDAAESIALEEHEKRLLGAPDTAIGSVEVWAARVVVTPRPLVGIPGGTHIAWLITLVEPSGDAAELVIVDANTGAVVETEASPVGVEQLRVWPRSEPPPS